MKKMSITCNILEDAARLKALSKANRKRSIRGSKLDKFKFEVLKLHSYGCSLGEIKTWLSEQKVIVERSTIQRWIDGNKVSAETTSTNKLSGNETLKKARRKAVATFGKTKTYTDEQFLKVISRQNDTNSLCSRLCWACGIRPSELITIRITTVETNTAIKDKSGEWYEVIQIDGRKRLVLIPADLSNELQKYKLENTRLVKNRDVEHTQYYAISGGAAWAVSFNRASTNVLGWSLGVNGLRSGFMIRRLAELQRTMALSDALKKLEDEMWGLPYNRKAVHKLVI